MPIGTPSGFPLPVPADEPGALMHAAPCMRPGPDGPVPASALVLHEHVAFGTPVGLTTAPAWYTLRLLQANIGPIEKEIHDVVLRHTRYGITVFANTHETLRNMKTAVEENTVT